MDRSELAALIDHTVLGPETAPGDVERVVAEAADHGMNACVPPGYVAEAAGVDPDVTLATVVGFPHGQHASETKRREGVLAWKSGVDELDVVINVGRLKAGGEGASTDGRSPDRPGDRVGREAVATELEELVAAVPIPVKVIVETALLSDEEKREACEAAVAADAAMVKTSTGFGGGGATVADVELMSEYLPVKASGGIGDYETAMAMIDAGAERIGASSGAAILEGAPE